MGANILPQWTKPTRTYRNLFLIAGGQQRYNFDGDLTDRQVHLFASTQMRNYWGASLFYIHRPSVLGDRLSRGGPVLRQPGVDVWSLELSSDERKNVAAEVETEINRDGDGFWDASADLSLRLQPSSNITIRIGPSYSRGTTGVQYVTAVRDPTAAFDTLRYIFADVLQKSVGLDTRFNMTFSPALTLELFVQPFISSGQYARYKEFAAPRTLQRRVYGEDFGTAASTPAGTPGSPATITLDPDGGGPIAPFNFPDRSFTVRSLRGNAVLRWEYRPGSTLYLVWARSGGSSLTRGQLNFGEDVRALFEGPSENIFLIKVSYRLGV
jgi:hypothetical protein